MKRMPTILVAEDDENDRFFVQRAFKKANFPIELQFVEDGEHATAYLSGLGKYDDRRRFPMPILILLDLKMPKLNGFEVLEWLKTQQGLRRLPVAILSSSALQSDINRAYDLGVNAYLIKPISLVEFEKVFRKVTEFFTIDTAHPVTQ
jgi:CheY-like chemotaxis protein